MLGLIVLVQVITPIGYYGLSALAPFILKGWGINRQQYGLLLSAFSTGTFLLAFPGGILTDRIGVLRMLLAGQAIIGVFISFAPWLPWYTGVLAIMFLAGTGYGLLHPAGSKAVYSWFPPQRRAVALSIKQSSLPLCGALSGLLFPPLSLLLGWRESWMASGLTTLAAAILTGLVYRDPPSNYTQAAADAALPLSAIRLLRHGPILRLIFTGFLLTSIHISWHSYIAVYLTDHLHMTAVLAGTFLALMQAIAILGRPVLGILSDIFFGGRRRVVLVIVGIVSFLLGLWLAFLPSSTPLWVVAVILGLFGFTGVSWHGVHLTWMTEIAGPTAAGTAAGLWTGCCHLGVIFIGPVFGAIVDYTGTYTEAWLFTCLLSVLVTIILISVRAEKSEARETKF